VRLLNCPAYGRSSSPFKERAIVMWSVPRLVVANVTLSTMLYVPAEWREQVEELVVALKTLLTAAHKPR
jgi:hypothetical protein